MTGGLEDLIIKNIEPGDKLTGLSLGHSDFAPLKAFLKKQAKAFETQSLARTYAAFRGERLRGYITLVCGEVAIKPGEQALVDQADVHYPYRQYPAVKIARLAVDTEERGAGLGRDLVSLSMGIAKAAICPAVGCRFITVDAKRASIEFYRRCGFTMLDTVENRDRSEPVMWLDLSKV